MGHVSTVVKLEAKEVIDAVVAAARTLAGVNVGSATASFEVTDRNTIVSATVEFRKTERA